MHKPGEVYAGIEHSPVCLPGLDCLRRFENRIVSVLCDTSQSESFNMCKLCPLCPESNSMSIASLADR